MSRSDMTGIELKRKVLFSSIKRSLLFIEGDRFVEVSRAAWDRSEVPNDEWSSLIFYWVA